MTTIFPSWSKEATSSFPASHLFLRIMALGMVRKKVPSFLCWSFIKSPMPYLHRLDNIFKYKTPKYYYKTLLTCNIGSKPPEGGEPKPQIRGFLIKFHKGR